LQTREQIQAEVQKRLGISATATTAAAAEKSGGGGGGGLSYLQTQMENMQKQLQAIKNRLQQYGTGSMTGLGGSNMTTPDFQPNSQHNKTFLRTILNHEAVLQPWECGGDDMEECGRRQHQKI